MGYGRPSAIVVKKQEIEDGEEGDEAEDCMGWPPPGIFSHEYQNKGVKDHPSLMNIKGKEIKEKDEVEEVEDLNEVEDVKEVEEKLYDDLGDGSDPAHVH